MVAEANRALVVETDADALSGALAALIEQPERRRLLGDANRERARTLFDEGLMIQRYAELFSRAMGSEKNILQAAALTRTAA